MVSGRTRCPRCGEGVRGAPAFCPACGTRLATGDEAAVEVELLDDRATATMGAGEVVFDAPGRRRGRTVGVAVAGALALAVGVSVATGGDRRSAAPTPTTVIAATTTTTAAGATTSSDAPTTTTTLGPVAVGTGPMFGETTGLSLVTTFSSELYRIDLDTGIAVPLHAGPQSGDAGLGILTTVGLVVGDQNGSLRLLAPGATTPAALVDPADATSRLVVNGANFVGEGPPGRLWLMSYDDAGQHVGYLEPARGGGFTEVPMPVSTGGVRADGLGGVLFTAPGGVYRAEPGGSPSRVSEGYLLDAANGHVLTLECDASLRCVWQVLDQATGSTWRVPVDGDVASLFNGGAALSPDGEHIVRTLAADSTPQPAARVRIEVFGREGRLAVFDETLFGNSYCSPFGCGNSAVWSTDGTWLVGLSASDSMWGWRPGLAAPVVAPVAPVTEAGSPGLSGMVAVGPTSGLPVRPA